MKKMISLIAAAAVLCGVFTGCGKSKKSTSAESSSSSQSSKAEEEGGEAVINVPAKPIQTSAAESQPETEPVQGLEERIEAASGDAFIAVSSKDWRAEYMGYSESAGGLSLAYGAVNAAITGNGDYTAKVTADTKGFRLEATGDMDKAADCEGLEFMSLMIKDGEKKFPGMIVTVNSVKVDGNEIELQKKVCTSSDDGVDTQATLYNVWIDAPQPSARSVQGALYKSDGTPEDFCSDYGPRAVNIDDFANWTTIEVNFTVSGV